jgi:hypothetical protein
MEQRAFGGPGRLPLIRKKPGIHGWYSVDDDDRIASAINDTIKSTRRRLQEHHPRNKEHDL